MEIRMKVGGKPGLDKILDLTACPDMPMFFKKNTGFDIGMGLESLNIWIFIYLHQKN
jgi:hypothetical protein